MIDRMTALERLAKAAIPKKKKERKGYRYNRMVVVNRSR
jgi:hypothetical protein